MKRRSLLLGSIAAAIAAPFRGAMAVPSGDIEVVAEIVTDTLGILRVPIGIVTHNLGYGLVEVMRSSDFNSVVLLESHEPMSVGSVVTLDRGEYQTMPHGRES